MISLQNGLGNVEDARARGRAGARARRASDLRRHAPRTRPGARHRLRRSRPRIGALAPGRAPARDAAARRWAAHHRRRRRPGRLHRSPRPRCCGPRSSTTPPSIRSARCSASTTARCPSIPESRALMDAVIDEAFAVAARRGRRRSRGRTPPRTAASSTAAWCPSTYDHRSSMLQDLERGRRTEIDAINGAVWQPRRGEGYQTPVNAALTRLAADRGKRQSQGNKAKGKRQKWRKFRVRVRERDLDDRLLRFGARTLRLAGALPRTVAGTTHRRTALCACATSIGSQLSGSAGRRIARRLHPQTSRSP